MFEGKTGAPETFKIGGRIFDVKIFLIDWNNMTPQYTYPLIHSMRNSQDLNINFISNDDFINSNVNKIW